MTRYIDADLLLEEIENNTPLNWTDSERETQEQFDYQVFKHMIEYQPTANVAPMEEVERLQNILDSYIVQYGTVAHKEVLLKKERADTVKEMRERLKELAFPESECGWDCVYIRQVDGVAKEILEGTQND